MPRNIVVTCWQCDAPRRFETSAYHGPAHARELRRWIELAGWWEYSPRMRFCAGCATSAKLALGVIDAGVSG